MTIEEFLLDLPFREAILCGLLKCVVCFGTFGRRGMIEYLEMGKGTLVRLGP